MSTKAHINVQAKTPAAPTMARIPQYRTAEPQREVEGVDIPTQLENAARLGHSLGAINVSSAGPSQIQAQSIQRQELPEEEDELQLKPETDTLQRQEIPEDEEDEELQLKPDMPQVGLQGGPVAPDVEAAIQRAKGGGQPLDGTIQAQIGERLGHDFSGVRVHTDVEADALNRQLQAKAFTTGRDIFFKRGLYSPGSGSGRELLAHELTHVVQQGTGMVSSSGDGITVRPAQDNLEQMANFQGNNIQLASGHNKYLPSGDCHTVQRKIGEPENVIFGLENKTPEAIDAAVNSGYTTFDGADTYGDTILSLAFAIHNNDKNKSRDDFEIIYKIDRKLPENLEAHLRLVANLFDGFIDHVLIHKVTDEKQAKEYDPILQKLKGEKIIRNVGAGDVNVTTQKQIDEKDSFEVPAENLVLASDRESLIKALNDSEKPVFVYNIFETLKKVLGPETKPTQGHVNAMIAFIEAQVQKAEPILSSSQRERIEANLKIRDAETMDFRGQDEVYKAIKKYTEKEVKAVPISEMNEAIQEKVSDVIFHSGFDWSKEKFTQEDQRKVTEKIGLFKKEELDVSYEGTTGKKYTLRELLKWLSAEANCDRSKAVNFLTGQ